MGKLQLTPVDKNMSNGMRCMQRVPLTDEEIKIVMQEIRRIEADETKFVFNDEAHIGLSTCYSYYLDIVFVTKNILPDDKYGSTHPRDLMSIRAVLAHEYYGHRTYRQEYLDDLEKGISTTPKWEDECRASITAAKITPNLTLMDKSYLVQDAIFRAREAGMYIENDDFMKEVLYGYSSDERNISPVVKPLVFVSKESKDREAAERYGNSSLSTVKRNFRIVR